MRKAQNLASVSRRVYAYSVVSGGVYDAEELARARRTDAVVRAHYIGFSERPTFYRTQQNLFLYVSYRKRDRVYWTKSKHRIPKGELLLKDRAGLARARCGNQLSLAPRAPVETEDGPDDDVLTSSTLPKLPFLGTPEKPDLAGADLDIPALPGVDQAAPVFVGVAEPGGPVLQTGNPGYTAAGFPAGVAGVPADRSAAKTTPSTGFSGDAPTIGSASTNAPIFVPSTPPGLSLVPVPGIPVQTPEPDYARSMWFALPIGLLGLQVRKVVRRGRN